MPASSSSVDKELSRLYQRTAAGISPGLVRMSIGYTGTLEQRWRQLRSALDDVGQIARRQTA